MLNDIKRECLEIRLNQARGLATCGYLWPIIGQCYTVVKVTVTCLAVLEPGSVTVVTTASQGDRQLPPLHKLVQGIYAHQQVDLENTITEGLNQQLHNHTEVMWTCHNKGVVSNYTHWLEQPQSESGIISKGHQKMNSITDGLSISTPSAMIGSSYYDVSSLADAETDKSFHSHTSISTFAIITQSFHFHQHVTTNGWYQSTQLSYGVTSSRIITCTKCRNYTKKPHRRPPKAPPLMNPGVNTIDGPGGFSQSWNVPMLYFTKVDCKEMFTQCLFCHYQHWHDCFCLWTVLVIICLYSNMQTIHAIRIRSPISLHISISISD